MESTPSTSTSPKRGRPPGKKIATQPDQIGVSKAALEKDDDGRIKILKASEINSAPPPQQLPPQQQQTATPPSPTASKKSALKMPKVPPQMNVFNLPSVKSAAAGNVSEGVRNEQESANGENIHRYRRYRENYAEKLQWRFYGDNELQSMHPYQISEELKLIRLLVNTTQSTPMVSIVVSAFAKFVTEVVNATPYKGVLTGYQEEVVKRLEDGYFHEDIEQLIIEHPSWFSMSPEFRIVSKLASIGQVVFERNTIHSRIASQGAKPAYNQTSTKYLPKKTNSTTQP